MASTWAPPFWMIIAVTRSGCMTANRKPTDAPMSERYSAYEERFSFSVNFSVTDANRSKRIIEIVDRRCRTFAISREVWGNDMIFIRKHGNQIAEHMRRRRKAVQEQNGGSISTTGFAIEDFQPLQVKRAIENGRRTRICRVFPIHYRLSYFSRHALLSFSLDLESCSTSKLFLGACIAALWALGNFRVLTDERE